MKRLLYIFAIISLLCSCSKEEGGNNGSSTGSGTITITSGTELSFAGDATSGKSISFTAGDTWSASSSATWCKLSSTGGAAGSVTLTVTVDKNETQESRNASITIRTQSASANVAVKQDVIYIMDFTETNYVIPCTGDTIKVNLATNTSYEYSIPEECTWIKAVTKTKAINNYVHYFYIEPNEDYDSRSGKIDFINKNNREKKTLTVSQLQKDAIIPADSVYTFEAKSQKFEFGISSNIEYDISCSAEWIKFIQTETKALINKNFTIEISENSGFDTREGIITVKSKDITQTIKIIQKAWAQRWTATILHCENIFETPNFSGRYMGGMIEWGDGKTDTYKSNIVHEFGNSAQKSTTYNLHATEMHSLEIPVINSIKSIRIVYKEEEK